MRNIAEIKRADEEALLGEAKSRIKRFPILRRIYDDQFLKELAKHKHDYDNLLLFWLVINNPIDGPLAIKLFEEIEEDLRVFKHERDLHTFDAKLRQWEAIPFESAIVELEFAAEYKRKGCQIELEPVLPNKRRSDFSAITDAMKIYFEVKMIYREHTLKEHKIIDELSERLDGMEEPFAVSIDMRETVRPTGIPKAAKYIRRKLRTIEQTPLSLRHSFAYPEKGEPALVIDIVSRLPVDERGFISGFVFGGGMRVSWRDIRSKIASAVSQLHPDHPGVIIIRPESIATTDFGIRNALFGDLSVSFFQNDQLFRGGSRIFSSNKNKRLSTVICYRKTLHESGYTRRIHVYHNPCARTKLPTEIFEGDNVTQFVVRRSERGGVHLEKTT